jgi:hypothetical protein
VPGSNLGVPRPGYIQVALNHPIFGRPLVLRSAFGTSIPELAPDDIKDFPLVRLPAAVEGEIADMAERAVDLRAWADELEDTAIKAVDFAVDALFGITPI